LATLSGQSRDFRRGSAYADWEWRIDMAWRSVIYFAAVLGIFVVACDANRQGWRFRLSHLFVLMILVAIAVAIVASG
jgi:hypothetical protein